MHYLIVAATIAYTSYMYALEETHETLIDSIHECVAGYAYR